MKHDTQSLAKRKKLMAIFLGMFFCVANAQESVGPVLEFAMGDTLSFSEEPISLRSDKLGDWSVHGIATGLTFRQTNPTTVNEASYSGFSNAQMIVEKKDGLIQLFAQTGLYSIPIVGISYLRAQPTTETGFGYLPHAYVSVTPNTNWSLALGKIPAMGGVEATFTYQNSNIQRGLLWVQTNSISRGMQLSYSDGPFSAAATWNDGAYSDVYNWLGGLASIRANERSTYTASWVGSVSGNAANTVTTPLLQNNSQIGNLIYQYAGERWAFTPYLQYTYVPERTSVGINGSSGTFGVAMLATYYVTPQIDGKPLSHKISIPIRFEYQSSHGDNGVTSIPAGLMYGPGSSAWSATVTPTIQWKSLFARGEFSYVKAFNPSVESAFDANGLNNNQVRLMLEAGILY